MRPRLIVPLLAICLWAACTTRQPQPGETRHGNFDYYLLNLSWAPEFCATHARSESSAECNPRRHYGFIVHGLWPQNEDGSYPQNCAPAPPPPAETVRDVLSVMPNRGLIDHEWTEHGTCSGLAAKSYFATLERAYHQLQIPSQYRAPAEPLRASPSDVEQAFADANRAAASTFRLLCEGGELSGIEVCLTRDLRYRACGSGVRECRARFVSVRPLP